MESIDLQMGDLFDTEARGGDDDEDFGATAPLPDLDDGELPMREGEEENQEEDVVANLQRLSKGAAKKRVMKPQPKLDAERLKSNRGLPILKDLYKGVKFKGKGHEAADLVLLMNKMEHWAHRLFPKMTFDQMLERLEKLGAKKNVQTTIKRIRLDMPILAEDFVEPVDSDPETAAPAPENEDMDAEDAFDEIMREEREKKERQQQQQADLDADLSLGDEMMTPIKPSASSSAAAAAAASSHTPSSIPCTPQQTSSQTATASVSGGMTPEQRAKMEANKLKAMQKRAARLGVSVESLMPKTSSQLLSATASSSSDGPSPTNVTKDDSTIAGPTQSENAITVMNQSEISISSCSQSSASFQDGQRNDSAPSEGTRASEGEMRSQEIEFIRPQNPPAKTAVVLKDSDTKDVQLTAPGLENSEDQIRSEFIPVEDGNLDLGGPSLPNSDDMMRSEVLTLKSGGAYSYGDSDLRSQQLEVVGKPDPLTKKLAEVDVEDMQTEDEMSLALELSIDEGHSSPLKKSRIGSNSSNLGNDSQTLHLELDSDEDKENSDHNILNSESACSETESKKIDTEIDSVDGEESMDTESRPLTT